MALLFIFLSIALIFFAISKFFAKNDETELSNLFFAGAAICVIIILIVFISIPVCRSHDRGMFEKYKAFKETIQNQRLKYPNSVESATILKDIADWNQNIASIKHDNKENWDWWTDDIVDKMEFIK